MEEKRICPDCGREWTDKVIFCMGCGARTIVKSGDFKEKVKQINVVSRPEENIFDETKPLSKPDNFLDIEDLILAYLRKVSYEKSSENFIECVREIVNR